MVFRPEPKPEIYTPKRGDEHRRPFHMGLSPGLLQQQDVYVCLLFRRNDDRKHGRQIGQSQWHGV